MYPQRRPDMVGLHKFSSPFWRSDESYMLISECRRNDKGVPELRNAIRHVVKTVTIWLKYESVIVYFAGSADSAKAASSLLASRTVYESGVVVWYYGYFLRCVNGKNRRCSQKASPSGEGLDWINAQVQLPSSRARKKCVYARHPDVALEYSWLFKKRTSGLH